MAKRKRKMTLFDVMHTGQPIGLQVRTRIPSYQPTPELPVTKKLAKLFGRKAKPENDQPLTAAEKLEQLRRELGGSRVESAPPEPPARVEKKPEKGSFFEEREQPDRTPVRPTFRNAERVAQAFAATAEPEPRLPSAPRRSFRDVIRDRWAIASPRLQAVTVHLRSLGSKSLDHAFNLSQFTRELYGRYAVTAAAALGVVVLLCGSFYAGKLLFNRPASAIATNEPGLADPKVRPDVLDVASNSTRSNEPLANMSSGTTETKLEHNTDRSSDHNTDAQASNAKPGVFGGRRADLNYIIVQSYFSEAEADATVDVLNKYGLKTSVELNLPRWAMPGKNLYSVVSTDGFAKMTGNDAFQTFMTKVNKISDTEAGNTLPKKLDPRPYRLQPQAP